MSIVWKGVMPAVTTHFTANDELDLDLFKINLQAQIDAGVHGIVLGGTLGEASTLTDEERSVLTKTAVEITKGKIPVLMNIAE
jgi:dihydrodipicolinate synthase/N-acetylneuraminate lyase